MCRFMNADGEHERNDLEQDVNVLEGHVLIEEFADCGIAKLRPETAVWVALPPTRQLNNFWRLRLRY